MAIKKIKVLVCDACGTVQPHDDPIDFGGVEIAGYLFHHGGGGGFGERRVYICLDCANKRKLADILHEIEDRKHGNDPSN